MAISDQVITDRYAVYLGDCMEVLPTMPEGSAHLSIYSPPFAGLYQYSSSERDLSNCLGRDEFFKHYAFVVQAIHRVTMPGRMSAVHCTDIPSGNSGLDFLYDFPGDIIRLHEQHGWKFIARYHVWKEPLTVRNRTMTKSLSHKNLTIDSTRCSIANADQLLIFRRSGTNPIPVAHPTGLTGYAGARPMPAEALEYRNWDGSQLENKFSHWIWRQYASAFWDDVRIDRVLPYRSAKDFEDEKHAHPLQLDVIERGIVLWSNPGEVVLTPFMGIGSEVYSAVVNGRRGIGVELKANYYRQAVKNLAAIAQCRQDTLPPSLFGEHDDGVVVPEKRERTMPEIVKP
jgi:DNA modification methylase